MSPFFISREAFAIRSGRAILLDLKEGLEYKYHYALARLYNQSSNPQLVGRYFQPLHLITTFSEKVAALRRDFSLETLPEISDALNSMMMTCTDELQRLPHDGNDTREILINIIQLIVQSDKSLGKLHARIAQPASSQSRQTTVLISTDLLFKCSQSLFPAERMIVVAGRSRGHQIELGTEFDVTGQASSGHVRADPQKLSQALIAMSASGAHLAAWLHSHPGMGMSATHPSSIDLQQHADWLRDYSPRLLSGIFVRDRQIRFWGTALDDRQIQIQFVGHGISMLEGDPNVYSINFT